MVDRKPAASGQASTTPVTRRATSPYGTRSRNRGVGRVNYAEDKDDHMDFEPTSTTTSTSTATPVAAVTNGSSQTSSSSRRQSTAAAAASTKENPPNAPSTATSKKRKASQPVVYKVEDRGLSNMPYFNKPFLKDGKITSEDGLTLQVNGKIWPNFNTATLFPPVCVCGAEREMASCGKRSVLTCLWVQRSHLPCV